MQKHQTVIVRDLQVRLVPIDQLIPNIRNSRTHTDEQVAKLTASIREFGWTNPLLIGLNRVIIAGHARWLAGQKLGLTEVPVIELNGLTEAQCRALAIADNQLAISGAGWDEDLLRLELTTLREESFEISLIGFDDEELAHLLTSQEAAEGLVDDAEIPEILDLPISLAGRRGRPFPGLSLLRRNWGRLCRRVGCQALDSRPNAVHGGFAVRELLYWLLARQAVPDIKQAGGGPLRRQLREFFGIAETARLR